MMSSHVMLLCVNHSLSMALMEETIDDGNVLPLSAMLISLLLLFPSMKRRETKELDDDQSSHTRIFILIY